MSEKSESEQVDEALDQLRGARGISRLIYGTPVAAERYTALLVEAERVLIEADAVAADRRHMRRMVGLVDDLEQRVFTLESAK